MQKAEKKIAAALAAVQLYLQEEEDAANALAAQAAPVRVVPAEPGQWAQAGRMEMMSGRKMVQLRAFSSGR